MLHYDINNTQMIITTPYVSVFALTILNYLC